MRPFIGPYAPIALCLVVASCGSSPVAAEETGQQPSGAESDPPVVSPTTPSATPAGPAGLMMREGKPPGSPTESFVTSSVVMVNWSDIQPTSASDPPDWSTIDSQLAALEAGGVDHVRLRIMAGGDAPTWVKRLGNAAGYFNGVTKAINCSPASQGDSYGGVAVQNVQRQTACIPFFWTEAYLSQYRSLMELLAARLASDPAKYSAVSTIVDSACMAVFAEVFYRGQSVGATNETLYEAGLTHPADVACQQTAITIHKEVFGTSRRTSVAINDWDIAQATPGKDGSYRTAVWYDGGATWATYEFAEWARQELTFGDGQTLLEVQNNGLHSTGASCQSGNTGTASYWCYISQYPGRHGFQTQSYQALPLSPSGASLTLAEDLNNGLALHAEYIELPSGMTSADWRLMGCFSDHLLHGKASPCSD